MVERLKAAIEKARLERERSAADGPPAAPRRPAHDPASPAASNGGAAARLVALPALVLDPVALVDRKIVTPARVGPANVAIDVLRTRMLRACAERGWRRIGVTSPTRGCGKTTIALNLVFSIARQPSVRVVFIDLDLRSPMAATRLGVRGERRIASLVEGTVEPTAAMERWGERLGLALNDTQERDAAELLNSTGTKRALDAINALLEPAIVVIDLPPLLEGDDALGALGALDAVLLVSSADRTRAAQIEACDRLIDGATGYLGLVLNRCEDATPESYAYDGDAA